MAVTTHQSLSSRHHYFGYHSARKNSENQFGFFVFAKMELQSAFSLTFAA